MLGTQFFAMGCQMQGLAWQLPTVTAQALTQLPEQFATAERLFSRFLPDSELMQLNRQRQMTVSPVLYQMLQHSLTSAWLTAGLITPTVYGEMVGRGYQYSFDKQTITPNVSAKTAFTPALSNAWQGIELDKATHQVRLPDGVWLDLGGFAKGLTAYALAKRIAPVSGGVLIDAGGDIAIQPPADLYSLNQTWQVELPCVDELTLPTDFSKALSAVSPKPKNWQCTTDALSLNLPSDKAWFLATSGIDYRHWQQDGKWQHHLVNPLANGGQTPSDIVCASVLVPDDDELAKWCQHPALQVFLQTSNRANLAQTLSKLCCLLGVAGSLEWLAKHQLLGDSLGLSWLVATANGFQQWLNPAMLTYVTENE